MNSQKSNNGTITYTKPYMGYYNVLCPKCGSFSVTQICPCCGLDLSKKYTVTIIQQENAPINPATGIPISTVRIRRKSSIVATVASIIVLALCVITSVAATLASESLQHIQSSDGGSVFSYNSSISDSIDGSYLYKPGISVDEYKKLKNGMTYLQVSAIAGGDGTVKEYSEEAKTSLIVWASQEVKGAYYNIYFKNDAVTDIIYKSNGNVR